MKKITILMTISLLMLTTISKAQYVNIPDSNFRKVLINLLPSCFNGAGQLDTTCSGVSGTTYIFCQSAGIKELTGIEYFKNLNQLYCHNNLLTFLPNFHHLFGTFDCSSNKLTSPLNIPDSIISLDCSNNLLTVFRL